MIDKNGRTRIFIDKIPVWVPSAVVLAAVLWLTLAPQPLGPEEPMLFKGADKVAHGIMFGGLTVTVLFDNARRIGWHRNSLPFAGAIALGATLLGVIIEFLQKTMDIGRSFEFTDMVADATGAIACAAAWLLIQPFFLPADSANHDSKPI